MTNEEIMELTSEQIETRMSEIKELIEKNEEGTDFEALNMELDSIQTRKSFLAEEARKADIMAVVNEETTSETTIEIPKEERKMTDIKEIRNSEAYINAFADYIKSGDDRECRSLLSELATGGQVPVPSFVEDEIKTAWSENKVLARVKKSYIKGILRVGFELSATGAVVHNEGAEAPSEETLTMGIITLSPKSIKKWITISDETLDLKGEAFVRYVYEELSYQVAKKAEDEGIAAIEALPTTATSTSVAAAVVNTALSASTIAEAISSLSDRAVNPVIIMNRASYSAFKAVQYASNYPIDVFEGLEVIFNDSIEAYASASANETYAYVGDLSGLQYNFPNGEDITIKMDENSLSEADLVKFTGRMYAGIAVTMPNGFVKIQKNA